MNLEAQDTVEGNKKHLVPVGSKIVSFGSRSQTLRLALKQIPNLILYLLCIKKENQNLSKMLDSKELTKRKKLHCNRPCTK